MKAPISQLIQQREFHAVGLSKHAIAVAIGLTLINPQDKAVYVIHLISQI